MPQPPAPTIPIGLAMIMRNENRWQTEVYQILDSVRFFEKHFSVGGRNATQREGRNATEQSAFTGPRAFSFAGLAKLFFLVFFFLRESRQRNYPFTLFQIDETHALGVAADDANVFYSKTYDLSLVRDEHELIVLRHLLSTHDPAGFIRGLHRNDALAAARLEPILVHLGTLAVAVLGYGQNIGPVTEHFHADHRVPFIEPHRHHAIGSASSRPNL